MTRPLSFYVLVLSFVALVSPLAVDAQVGRKVTIIDANLATEEELRAVPNLTPALVSQIVSRRPFATTTELNAVLSGPLSKEQVAQVYERIFVPLNLNTASKEEILLIPRMGNRMLHEFEEYRPYKALAQFHREIGKYVDDKEVARLERYVTIGTS